MQEHIDHFFKKFIHVHVCLCVLKYAVTNVYLCVCSSVHLCVFKCAGTSAYLCVEAGVSPQETSSGMLSTSFETGSLMTL